MAVKFEKISDGEYELDVCGYSCPHPQMYTKKALQKMNSGDTLILKFNNPSSGESILAMCESSGDEMLERSDAGGISIWKIQKA